MRSRLPAVLFLLSAFLLGHAPGGLHPPALPAHAASSTTASSTTAASVTAAHAAWWSSPVPHAEHDAALSRLHPANGLPTLPTWLAVLPSGEQPDPHARSSTIATGARPAAPRPAGRRAPARAPPSTTR